MIEVLEALGTKECTSQPANNYNWKYTRFRAPEHCVQYFTGLTGTINSYGFNLNNPAMSTLLQAQNYKNCIRKEKGEGVTPPAVWDGKSAKCFVQKCRQKLLEEIREFVNTSDKSLSKGKNSPPHLPCELE